GPPLDVILQRAPEGSGPERTRVRARAEMHRRHDLIGVPGVAGLAAEVHATLERVFASDPTDVVSVVPERSAVADTAVIGKDHAALPEQRPFDGPWDGAAPTHELQGLLSRLRIVICLTRRQLSTPQSKPEFVDDGRCQRPNERGGIHNRMVIDEAVEPARPFRQAEVGKTVFPRACP